MWAHINSPLNLLYDFSTLEVGSKFDSQIETKIDGTSDFLLGWDIGDTILFKEFGGEFYDEPPLIPIVDYSVKAKIFSPT